LLIDRVADTVTYFHILGSKPAAYALVLEIRVEALGEGVVLARIANEAGVELD
jgi:hypothetical protein